MSVDNEYFNILRRLYDKSLILEEPSDFHPVLSFYYVDAMAHLDFTLCMLSFNYMSVRNIMNMEYLRWRIDEEKIGDRVHFPAFINWLKANHREKFDGLPVLWKEIYDENSPARYIGFNIVLNPDTRAPLPSTFFNQSIQEFFAQPFLKSIYNGASLAQLFDEFLATEKGRSG